MNPDAATGSSSREVPTDGAALWTSRTASGNPDRLAVASTAVCGDIFVSYRRLCAEAECANQAVRGKLFCKEHEPKVHKFKAKPVTACIKCGVSPLTIPMQCRCGGKLVIFPSTGEWERWCELLLLEKASVIRNLEYQPVYPIIIGGRNIGKWVADSRYFEGNEVISEDFKGYATPLYKFKKKIVEALYHIKIREVRRA